jgi:NADH-quinone oxidoreductase subunit H
MDPLNSLLEWIRLNIPAWVYITIVVHLVVLGTVAYLILLERKVASWAQDRIGPNRTGFGFGLPFLPKFLNHVNGLGQPLADGLKFIFKEDYAPGGVDIVLFTLAPMVMIIVIIVSIAAVPWGGTLEVTRDVTLDSNVSWATKIPVDATPAPAGSHIPMGRSSADHTATWRISYRYPFQIANLNIGVLFILATLSLAVYGVVIGGWASNNKYSFLGGLRATVNMISYEIPMGLAVLCIVLMCGTLDLSKIVAMQCHYWADWIPAWNCFSQPLPFLMFLICIHAEANRAPFDLAEAEQELVGGYHTEYSSMRFALFFLAEYAGMITTSAVCVALFFGGWHLPWVDKLLFLQPPYPSDPAVTKSLLICLLNCVVFFAKTVFIIFVFMWVRWSLPRFRFDQLMMLAWRALIPIGLALLLMTAVIVYCFNGESYLMEPGHFGVDGEMAIWLVFANLATLAIIAVISTLIPAAPLTNRRVIVQNSRFNPQPATSN